MPLIKLQPRLIATIGLLIALFAPLFLNGLAFADADTGTASSNIVVQTIPGPTVAQKIGERAHTTWPWYLARGSGMVAAVALVILLISGIGQVTGFTYRVLEPLTAWASHRALGLVFGMSVLIHMFSLLFDKFLPFSLAQIFIPWLASYKPVTLFGAHLGSLYVACGVIAFYIIAAIIITSLVWIDKKPTTWKWLHILSYFVMILVFIHALYTGTDTAHGWVRMVWIFAAIAVAATTVHRLWRAYTAR